MPDLGRNDPCHCGSGKKYKKCCEAKDQVKEHKTLEKQWTDAEKKFEAEKKDQEATGDSKTAVPTAVAKKSEPAKAHVTKHQSVTAPKMSLPRKSGGG